ncbi:hypothetical protein BJ973_001686 [Actinoplanes tereljensis]|uniref:Uncharacterized protein n=1 Tax=Paractinoplanes tereljensis TaxID=571912 RepID=A0A919NKH6_9ACTN|nr:hypothetical protein [Actinoplanes tereljensis]GIF20410.1 hypothetical protein Ate02nite_31400 [Actinoplanes tereljensis]
MNSQHGDTQHEDFLRDEMRQALDSRHPDRTAMLNRIAANRAEATRPRARVARLAGSALAVATVLGIGGVGKWALADSHDPTPAAPPAATATPTPVPSVVATATAQPSREVTSRPRSAEPTDSTGPASAPAPSASLVRGHPGDTQVEKGTLWSDGSIEDSGDSVVTLRAGADLTELDLTVRVTQTPGLSSLGFESSADTVTATVTKQADALLYRFTLRAGATLTAGEYKLTAKWSGGDRNAADDTYEAYATSVERKRIHIYGNFAAKD